MKLIPWLLGVLLATPAFATLPKFINCENERGVVLEVSFTPHEAAIPIYEVQLKYQGKVRERHELALTKNSTSRFQLEGHFEGRAGWLVYIGLDRSNNEVSYYKAANGGMSPLPGLFFTNCDIR